MTRSNRQVDNQKKRIRKPALRLAKPQVGQSQEIKDYTTTVTILESITDAIFILNAQGNIEYANQSAQHYLQLPLNDIIGHDLEKFIKSDNELTLQLLNHGIRKGKLNTESNPEVFSNSEAELQGAREIIPILINFSTIPGADGKLKYIIVTAKEIAYRKSLEKELRNRQALSVSFDRLKALGEMSVGLVHTLGQPVTSMELRLEYISQLNDLDTIKKMIEELRDDIGKISGIVDKVRSYAQIMDKKQIRSIDVNGTLKAILKVLEYDLHAARVHVEQVLEHGLPAIDANEPELEQVFINIVANAIQAFESNHISGERTLRISTRAEEKKWIQVSIKDNAGGIDEAVFPEIFEPFYSTWDKDKHAGTGLSVARSIISSLGGDLTARVIGNSSVFDLRIPLTQPGERDQLINLIELLNS